MLIELRVVVDPEHAQPFHSTLDQRCGSHSLCLLHWVSFAYRGEDTVAVLLHAPGFDQGNEVGVPSQCAERLGHLPLQPHERCSGVLVLCTWSKQAFPDFHVVEELRGWVGVLGRPIEKPRELREIALQYQALDEQASVMLPDLSVERALDDEAVDEALDPPGVTPAALDDERAIPYAEQRPNPRRIGICLQQRADPGAARIRDAVDELDDLLEILATGRLVVLRKDRLGDDIRINPITKTNPGASR